MSSSLSNKNKEEELSEWRRKRQERQTKRQQQQDRDLTTEPNVPNEQVNDSLYVEDEPYQQQQDHSEDNTTMIPLAQKRKLEELEILKSLPDTDPRRKRSTIVQLTTTAVSNKYSKPSNESNNNHINNNNNNETNNNSNTTTTTPAIIEQQQQQPPEPARETTDFVPHNRAVSLLDQAAELHNKFTPQEREIQRIKEEEARILKEASKVQTNALQSAKEIADGKAYTEPMPSSWAPPTYILQQGDAHWQNLRKKLKMEVQGDDIPPPIQRFVDFKLPQPILDVLQKKGIQKPSLIQMQGLSVALAGRDMVGIAFTGSGKTLTFVIPLIMAALEEEMRMPLKPKEGPIGIILAPSRELARQTYDQVVEFCQAISHSRRYPELRSQLLIGGESVVDQLRLIQQRGIHCIVATPGRLRDLIRRKAIDLMNCRYICLDEADRLVDLGFDEECSMIFSSFRYQRQTLLFSATFPRKFQDFARETLVKPIIVNVGRAGAANLDVVQEVEYVNPDARIPALLRFLQKTAPPVIIFSERKNEVDDIHEYLLLKGVEAVSIHGGKDQSDRNEAIQQFRSGEKDVLVCSDIAAKGLDFPNIQHVINFDMPKEIENYVHRIGRTGRSGKTGLATTFINNTCDMTALLDLKGLLKEARQRIPPVLMTLEDPRENGNSSGGCSFCGGLGHSILDCPKIDKDSRRVKGGQKDVIAGGDY